MHGTNTRPATVRLALDCAAARQEVLSAEERASQTSCGDGFPLLAGEPSSVKILRPAKGAAFRMTMNCCQREIPILASRLAYKECSRVKTGRRQGRCESYLFVNASIRDFPATHEHGECSK